jgi:ABC-type nitrate/sulfonate/bicarbonate transport system substrate-binding protein
MKELAPKSRLKIEERVFTKGLDINPAIVAGEIDASAAAPDAAIARVLAIDSPILLMEELDRHQEDEFRGAAVD